MTSWVSCTPKGSIEYVIIYELCHLIHHNHTRAFYALQETIMPDWKKWKERLEHSLV
nr:M48 family metallopeptidase [Algoriphagus sp. Y33]